MKIVALIGLLAGSTLLTTGCATPGYSAKERNQQISRAWDYDLKEAADDWDYVLMLRPPSHMSIWDVQ